MTTPNPTPAPTPTAVRNPVQLVDRLFRLSVIVLAVIMVSAIALFIGQATIYKIQAFERGLHLRGGQLIGVDEPGWHVQIPLVDTVIIVKVNERLGYVERINAVTADNLTMVVSLQYTYRVTDAEKFALNVDDPERILFEFVQGKLRDVVNTQSMTDMMSNRTQFNANMLIELQAKEAQYGVQFVTVQIQSAEPPPNVVQAIEDRMVAVQRQEQAEAEAAQQRVLADAALYTAQKEAEAEAYQIQQLAVAQASQIQQIAVAQKESITQLLAVLDQHPEIADKYLDYLMTQELKENSKWILSQTGTAPVVELRETTTP